MTGETPQRTLQQKETAMAAMAAMVAIAAMAAMAALAAIAALLGPKMHILDQNSILLLPLWYNYEWTSIRQLVCVNSVARRALG